MKLFRIFFELFFCTCDITVSTRGNLNVLITGPFSYRRELGASSPTPGVLLYTSPCLLTYVYHAPNTLAEFRPIAPTR